MNKIAAVAAAALLSAALTGCAGDPPPAPTETVTETETAAPEPAQTVTETVAPEPEPTVDDDLTDTALEMTWAELTGPEQNDICYGWAVDEDMMLDAFMEGAEESFDREDVRSFFAGKCA